MTLRILCRGGPSRLIRRRGESVLWPGGCVPSAAQGFHQGDVVLNLLALQLQLGVALAHDTQLRRQQGGLVGQALLIPGGGEPAS